MFAHTLPKPALRAAFIPPISHWLLGIMVGLRRTYCGLHGHDLLLHASRDRVFLACLSCGYETPGWRIDLRARHA